MSDRRAASPDPEIAGAENISLPVVEMEDCAALAGGLDTGWLNKAKSADRRHKHGSVLGGAVHDYMCGMISERHDGASIAETTLTKLGLGTALLRGYGMLGIDPGRLDCDYYRYLNGDPEAVRSFRGEYMSQYSFGEATLAALLKDKAESGA